MPAAARQSAALRALDALPEEGDDWRLKGPLVVRWNLHSGFRYDDAKTRYAPFDRLIDPDIATRGTLVHLVHVAHQERPAELHHRQQQGRGQRTVDADRTREGGCRLTWRRRPA